MDSKNCLEEDEGDKMIRKLILTKINYNFFFFFFFFCYKKLPENKKLRLNHKIDKLRFYYKTEVHSEN